MTLKCGLEITQTGTVSYSPSITMAVSVAVCEIFSVNERYDLENRVRGSFKIIRNGTI